jgi:hypothetical protein
MLIVGCGEYKPDQRLGRGREAAVAALHPRKRVGYLPCEPLGSRTGSDTDADQSSASVCRITER